MRRQLEESRLRQLQGKGENYLLFSMLSDIYYFAEIKSLHLRTFCKCGTSRICDLLTKFFFRLADLKLPLVRKYILYVLTNPPIAYKALKKRLLGLF
jgi:hypothetical protein